MGTAKKLVLASLVSTMMVLMFAIGFLPSLGVVDIGAAEEGEKLDMSKFLKLFLSDEKQLTGVDIISPEEGDNYVFLDSSVEFPLEAAAVTTPEGQGASVAFGVDGELRPAAGAWRGELVVDADADGTATIELSELGEGNVAGMHDLFALAELAKQVQVYQEYDVFAQTTFNVTLLDAASADPNGDGIIDNPFTALGPGQRNRTVIVNNGQQKIIILQDLDNSTKGTEELGVTIEEEDANGKLITIDSPSRDELETAGDIPMGAEAVLLAIISTDLGSMLNTDASPNEADNIGEFPEGNDGTTPIDGIGFGASYVELSILSSTDMGMTSDEVMMLSDGLTVDLMFSDLEGVNVDSVAGAGQWTHSTDVDDNTTVTVSPAAGWVKKGDSFIDLVNATLKTYVSYLSIFAPLESQFAVTDVMPAAAPGTNDVSEAAFVTINGNIPLAGDNLSTAAAANAAYKVYFGDPFTTGTMATFVDIPQGGLKQNEDIVTRESATVRVPTTTFTDNTTVDVWIFDAEATSDFAAQMEAFTFAVAPTVTVIEPDSGPLTNSPTATISGMNLDTVESVIFRDTVNNNLEASATINLAESTPTSIVITPPDAPAGVPGPVDVIVTTAGGVAANQPTYTYRAVPAVTSVDPAELAFDAENRTVVISGSDLNSVLAVTLAGLAVAPEDITEGDGTTLTVVAPDGPSAGAVGPVSVMTTGGASNTDVMFEFLPEQTGPDPLVVDAVSPDNAWVFGGIVARITGEGFAAGEGDPTVMFGTTAANVLEASDTEIYVEVPALAVTGQSDAVDVTVSRTVSAKGVVDPDSDTIADGFTYFRYIESNGVTTTAGTLSGGVGNVSVVLDADAPATTASLNIPVAFNTTKGSADRATLVRASKAPADFGLSPAENGANTADAWVFDFHLYSLDYNTGSATFTTGGVPTILEITDLAHFDPKNAAKLTTPVGSTNLAEANLASIALYGEVTSLEHNYPTGGTNFTPGSGEVYQSQLLTGEYTSDGTTISDLNNARLRNLGAIAIRTGVVPDISDFNITLEEATTTKGATVTASGPVDEMTELIVRSEEGGLGFLANPAFGDDLTTEAGFDAAIFGTLGDANGASEFERRILTPTDDDGAEVGTVDVGLVLAAEPDPVVPAFVFEDAFEFTGAGPGTSGLLRLLLVLLGLVGAGAGGGGGGGGGPCFIATAAYGTPMAAEIDALRAVRDTYLLDNAVGTALVDTYYRVSPAIADVVAQSPALAAAVRLMLVPVVFMAQVVMASPAVSLAVLMAAIGLVLMRRRAKKGAQA